MTIVTRFFHIRPLTRQNKQWVPAQRAGATVKVVGDTDNVGSVTVQFTLCSKNDLFCKRTGRKEAEKAEAQTISLRHLPSTLNKVSELVDAAIKKAMTPDQDYSYAIKYFLPK